jgi:hypothetical protein
VLCRLLQSWFINTAGKSPIRPARIRPGRAGGLPGMSSSSNLLFLKTVAEASLFFQERLLHDNNVIELLDINLLICGFVVLHRSRFLDSRAWSPMLAFLKEGRSLRCRKVVAHSALILILEVSTAFSRGRTTLIPCLKERESTTCTTTGRATSRCSSLLACLAGGMYRPLDIGRQLETHILR